MWLAGLPSAIVPLWQLAHGARRLAVVDEAHFPPRRCQVAALAEIGRLRMRLRLPAHRHRCGRRNIASASP